MVLSPNGRIIFLFARADRTPPQTDADRAPLFSAMTAYTGLVGIEAEDRFVITVGLARDPGWTGVQIRYFTVEGDRLKIWTPAHRCIPAKWAADSSWAIWCGSERRKLYIACKASLPRSVPNILALFNRATKLQQRLLKPPACPSIGSAPRRRDSSVEEDSTRRVVD